MHTHYNAAKQRSIQAHMDQDQFYCPSLEAQHIAGEFSDLDSTSLRFEVVKCTEGEGPCISEDDQLERYLAGK